MSIPRSYYGVLATSDLTQGIIGDQSDAVSEQCAEAIMASLESYNLLSKDGALDLKIGSDELGKILDKDLSRPHQNEFHSKRNGL